MKQHPIILDGNIFGLQVFGGVSGYAARLYTEWLKTGREVALILPRTLRYRGLAADAIAAHEPAIRERLPARISQYRNAATGHRHGGVYLSPYYRRPAGKVERFVVTVHDFTYEHFRKGAARFVHHHVKMAAIHAADAIIAISHATKRDLLRFAPGLDPQRIHVVHHGVDRAIFFPEPASAGDGGELAATVLFVGQRGGYKRFDLAVAALALTPDLRLGIVGPAPTEAEGRLLEQRLPGRWRFFGRVGDHDLRRLYSAAHAFLFPSDYEGFGLPVLEAMACGCPVLTSADAALREVGGKAARCAERQQAEAYAAELARLGDGALRTQLVADGHANAGRFRWEETARATAAILDGAAPQG